MSQSNALEGRRTRAIRSPLDRPIRAVASRFGSKAKEVERFLKFATVGSIGAVVDFTTLAVLQATVLPPTNPQGEDLTFNVVLATTLAFIAAISSNFTWNRLWTYPDSRSRSIPRQMAQFASVSFIGWLARTIWISSAYIPLGHALMPVALPLILLVNPDYVPSVAAEAKLGTMIAWFFGVIVVMIWNFIANRLWTYNDVE